MIGSGWDYVRRWAQPFLQARVGVDGRLDLEGRTPADVLAFVLAESGRGSRGTPKLMVAALRSLFDF